MRVHPILSLVALVGCAAPEPDAHSARHALAADACGPLVAVDGAIVVVAPGGGDDTAQLQCALDLAAEMGNATVRLLPGTYVTRQLVVHGLVGTLEGSGADLTILRNPYSPLAVTPVDFWARGEPSDENPGPTLLAFIDGTSPSAT